MQRALATMLGTAAAFGVPMQAGAFAGCTGPKVEVRCCNGAGEWVRTVVCVKQHIWSSFVGGTYCAELLCPPGTHMYYLIEYGCSPCSGGFAYARSLGYDCGMDCGSSAWQDGCWEIGSCYTTTCDPHVLLECPST